VNVHAMYLFSADRKTAERSARQGPSRKKTMAPADFSGAGGPLVAIRCCDTINHYNYSDNHKSRKTQAKHRSTPSATENIFFIAFQGMDIKV